VKGLAAESLQLLRAALFDPRFPALFELPVYGSIIGMFELNNLGEMRKPAFKVPARCVTALISVMPGSACTHWALLCTGYGTRGSCRACSLVSLRDHQW
jgi:hypothetical protein